MEVSHTGFRTCTWVAVGTVAYVRGLQEVNHVCMQVAEGTVAYVRGLQKVNHVYVGCSGHSCVCTWVAVR
jgi:hypothetical protein